MGETAKQPVPAQTADLSISRLRFMSSPCTVFLHIHWFFTTAALYPADKERKPGELSENSYHNPLYKSFCHSVKKAAVITNY